MYTVNSLLWIKYSKNQDIFGKLVKQKIFPKFQKDWVIDDYNVEIFKLTLPC